MRKPSPQISKQDPLSYAYFYLQTQLPFEAGVPLNNLRVSQKRHRAVPLITVSATQAVILEHTPLTNFP